MKRVAIITSSDTGYRGEREDLSGPAIREIVEKSPTPAPKSGLPPKIPARPTGKTEFCKF